MLGGWRYGSFVRIMIWRMDIGVLLAAACCKLLRLDLGTVRSLLHQPGNIFDRLRRSFFLLWLVDPHNSIYINICPCKVMQSAYDIWYFALRQVVAALQWYMMLLDSHIFIIQEGLASRSYHFDLLLWDLVALVRTIRLETNPPYLVT